MDRCATSGSLLPDRVDLADESGNPYLEFRRALVPRYKVLWAELLAVEAATFMPAVVLCVVHLVPGPIGGALLSGVLALWFGLCLYWISLFGHAAAHWDLASSRRTNDALANVFIFPFTGKPVAAYRRVHFQHHRRLGEDDDPENGYREMIDFRLLARSIVGVRFLDSVRRGIVVLPRESTASGATDAQLRSFGAVTVAGVVLHTLLVLVPLLLGAWFVSLGWLVGFVVVAPTLIVFRLILEHRPTTPDGAVVSRRFVGRVLAPWFGAAGFRSHAIHHWDPQVHSTRLRAVEAYLLHTNAREAMGAVTSTYTATFRALRG